MPYSTSDVNAFTALGVQTAKGTPQTTAAKLRFPRYISGIEESPEQEIVDVREGGFGMDYSFSYRKSIKGAGQLVLFGRPEILTPVLAWAVGGATWDGGSSPAVHDFHTGHSSYPFSTLFQQHPGSAVTKMYADARAAGITLELMSGEPMKVTVPWVSLSAGGSFAPLTPTYVSEEPFMFFHAPSILLDGTLDQTISSVKLTQAVNLEELQAQSITLDELVPQTRDLDIEVVRRFEDPGLWQKVYYGASGGINPTWSVATGSLRGVWKYPGSPTPVFDLFASLISWRSNAITGVDPDGKTVYETLTGRLLKGATHSAVIKLSNVHASAAVS